MAQIKPNRPYNDLLMDRVVGYLQTRDARYFSFAARFDDEKTTAFIRDLREGLSEITDSGSARKSAATGFTTSNEILSRIIGEWQAANGDWPEGSFPEDAATALGSSAPEDSPPPRVYVQQGEDVSRT